MTRVKAFQVVNKELVNKTKRSVKARKWLKWRSISLLKQLVLNAIDFDSYCLFLSHTHLHSYTHSALTDFTNSPTVISLLTLLHSSLHCNNAIRAPDCRAKVREKVSDCSLPNNQTLNHRPDLRLMCKLLMAAWLLLSCRRTGTWPVSCKGLCYDHMRRWFYWLSDTPTLGLLPSGFWLVRRWVLISSL